MVTVKIPLIHKIVV